ncbi:MAG: TatD family hydrolase [Oscillospiraceae bacterium]|nr:TatD family hydrolase [Oscillospiraceae bacterium]
MIFDSHAHYDDRAFGADRHQLLDEIFSGGGVTGIIDASNDMKSVAANLELIERYPRMWAAAGVHPHDAASMKEADIGALRAACTHPKIVAVGEIGLDYHYADCCPRETQIYWFERQMELAREVGLPVIVHDREAHEDTCAVLERFRLPGVLHCFSGGVELMRRTVALGMYVGLGGAVTFKNARKPLEVAAALPLERLLLETDAPYMTPEPFRGKRCESRHIAYTAAAIAKARNTDAETILKAAADNARRLFGIEE